MIAGAASASLLPPPMAMLPAMLEHDRKQAGWSVGQAAWRLGVSVSVSEYRELEAGTRSPSFEPGQKSARRFGWPRRAGLPLIKPLG